MFWATTLVGVVKPAGVFCAGSYGGGEGGILFNCRVKTYTIGTGAAAGRGMNGEGA